MPERWIPEEVETYFGASPIGPLLEVGRVDADDSHPTSSALREVFARVPKVAIVAVLEDEKFLGLYGDAMPTQQDWLAREWIIVEELHRRIRRRRRDHLLTRQARPAPYDEMALSDLELSKDQLVPLSEFDIEEGVLIRNGRGYVILPPTPSENSSYWVTRALAGECLRRVAQVRLDPLIRGDAADFSRMSYRMLWWGPPLLWEDVVKIQEEKFGRWAPGPLSNGGEFTDFAWVPRGDEQHLFLEEIPKRDDINVAGSRYFHVIFSRPKAAVVHLDGATRIYSELEWTSRYSAHVHRTGKIGRRVKVFRIDVAMEPDAISTLGGTFFVWNYDVSSFFGAPIPPSLLGNALQPT